MKTQPKVASLASKALTDDRIRAYVRCLSVSEGKFTAEQAAYFDVMAAFLTTKPTPDQFLQWQAANPFPGSRKSGFVSVIVRSKVPMPGASITLRSTASGVTRSAQAGPQQETVVEIPEDFVGTEVEVRMEAPSFAPVVRTIKVRDGIVVDFSDSFNIGSPSGVHGTRDNSA